MSCQSSPKRPKEVIDVVFELTFILKENRFGWPLHGLCVRLQLN
jgi:hypothetical protein